MANAVLSGRTADLLAAGTAATAFHLMTMQTDVLVDVAEKLSTKPENVGIDTWLTGLALSSALQVGVSFGIASVASSVLGDDPRQLPRPVRRAVRALDRLPGGVDGVCKFAAKAVFFAAAQGLLSHNAGGATGSLSPFQGLPDLLPQLAPLMQGDEILSSALQGLTSSLTTLARATSAVLDRAASASLTSAFAGALDSIPEFEQATQGAQSQTFDKYARPQRSLSMRLALGPSMSLERSLSTTC